MVSIEELDNPTKQIKINERTVRALISLSQTWGVSLISLVRESLTHWKEKGIKVPARPHDDEED